MIHWPYGHCVTLPNSHRCSPWSNAWCYTYTLCPRTMRGWGDSRNDLRSRSPSGLSGNPLGLGKSWPPGRWNQNPPSLVIINSFDLQWYCRSCKCTTHRNPYSSDFGGWIHQCSSYRSNSSLHLFFGRSITESGMVDIYVLEKVDGVSVIISIC